MIRLDKNLLKMKGVFNFTICRLIIFFIICVILYYIYFKYNYQYFIKHNISYGFIEKLKENDIVFDWAVLEHRSHLNELRRILFLKDNIHSFRIFSKGYVNIWPLYMNDLYFWCYTPFSFFIKSLKFFDLEGENYSFALEEIYKARETVFLMETKFYNSMRVHKDYFTLDEFTFHSIHHHWLILEMENYFITFIETGRQQRCKEFTFKPCYDMMFALDYVNYHIAMAQAKIDAIILYQEDLHLLQGFQNDLKYFIEVKNNLKFYACGKKTTIIEDLYYISKDDFKELTYRNFYNETFVKFIENEVLVVKKSLRIVLS